MTMYVIAWQYDVKPEFIGRFEQIYGPEGDWALFFRQSNKYIRTDLFRDATLPYRYITLDHWASKEAQEAFRSSHLQQYQEIDRRCEQLTMSEVQLGSFTAESA